MYQFNDSCFVKRLGFHINRVKGKISVPEHTHDFIEIVYTLKGSRSHYIDGKEVRVNNGDFLFINYGRTHAYGDSDAIMFNILLKPEFINGKLKDCTDAMELLDEDCFEKFKNELKREDCLCHLKGKNATWARNIVLALEYEYERYGSLVGSDEIIRSYLTSLLILIFREMSIIYDKPQLRRGIPISVIDYINENITQKINLEELAKMCHYNSSYFSRRFKESFGVSLSEYIHMQRIALAADKLKKTAASVEEISVSVGYTNRTLFYREFTERMGRTPAEYREQNK